MTRGSEPDQDMPAALTEQSSDGEPILKKYAGAVHIGADLTLYQRRAFNVLLFWAMPEMPKPRVMRSISRSWPGDGAGGASQRVHRLIESLDKMMEARVVWNLLDDKGELEEWESATLLPYVKVSRRERKVTYEFTRAFQERVYNPSEFAEIRASNAARLSLRACACAYENTPAVSGARRNALDSNRHFSHAHGRERKALLRRVQVSQRSPHQAGDETGERVLGYPASTEDQTAEPRCC
jgi:hypothetical protein